MTMLIGGVAPVSALEVEEIASFGISSANINVFTSSLAWYKGNIYTVNVEPAEWIDTGINLRTVVRKGKLDSSGKWHWQTHVLDAGTLDDPYHTQASIAIDKKGYVHVAYNMHNMPWQYSVSKLPGDISRFEFKGDAISFIDRMLVQYFNKTPFPSIGTAAIPGNQITYPAFFYDRQGELYVTYRFATRPKRRFVNRGYAGGVARYDAENRIWESMGGLLQVGREDAAVPGDKYPALVRAFAYTDRWSVYSIHLDFDHNNDMHVSWLWRKGGAGSTTSHPSYAYSRDGGEGFLNSNGKPYALPIRVDDADLIVEKGAEKRFYPKTVIESDKAGLPYILIHGVGQVRALIHLDMETGRWSSPEDLPYGASEFLVDEAGMHWAFATGPVILRRKDRASPWKVLYQASGDVKFGYPQVLHIPVEDKMLLYTQNIEAGLAKIYMINYVDGE